MESGDLDGALGVRLTRRVRDIVRSELYRFRQARPEDVEDVCSDCMVALLGKMEDFRSNGDAAAPIEDLEGYVAVLAQRACSAWSRRQYPAFHRLRTGLRYLLTSDQRFALWRNGRDEWVCGKQRWKTEGADANPTRPDADVSVALTGTPAEVVARLFERLREPLYFNDLVKLCAEFWVVDDQLQPIESVEVAAGSENAIGDALDREARLGRVWVEICGLPPRQRTALLLNMHGPDGECGTSLLILTGTASPREVAAAIGMPAEEFAGLLVRLPLSDLEIAERMQLTRQQVINLRKCARERLRRRMGAD